MLVMNNQRDLSCLLQMLFIKAEFKYKRCAKKYRYDMVAQSLSAGNWSDKFSFYCMTWLSLNDFAVSNSKRDFLGLYGQVNKRTRWMPRQLEAMKDVVICEKLG